MNGRERILAMLSGKKPDHLPLMPITMMYAADQINRPYGEYARDHIVLVEAQIATAERFEFDYVSVISDPAREAADLGAEVEYFDNQPPALNEQRALLHKKSRLNDFEFPDPKKGRLNDRVQGVAQFKKRVGKKYFIEGWVEGPCAQASDLRGINALMMDFYDDPEFVNALFDFVIEMELIFAVAQIEAGADIIGVGDAAASLVGPKLYKQFVLPAQKRMIDGLHSLGARVRLHICGKTRKIYEGMGSLGCEIVDLDSMNPMDEARKTMGPKQVLLGNISPVDILKNGTPDGVTRAIAVCHQQCSPRYIVGAGCEIPRETPPENVEALTQYAQSHQA